MAASASQPEWFRWKSSDIQPDTMHLSPMDHLAYPEPMDRTWGFDGAMPGDRVPHCSGLSDEDWAEVSKSLLALFTEKNGVLPHDDLSAQLDAISATAAKNRRNAEKRWAKKVEQIDPSSEIEPPPDILAVYLSDEEADKFHRGAHMSMRRIREEEKNGDGSRVMGWCIKGRSIEGEWDGYCTHLADWTERDGDPVILGGWSWDMNQEGKPTYGFPYSTDKNKLSDEMDRLVAFYREEMNDAAYLEATDSTGIDPDTLKIIPVRFSQVQEWRGGDDLGVAGNWKDPPIRPNLD